MGSGSGSGRGELEMEDTKRGVTRQIRFPALWAVPGQPHRLLWAVAVPGLWTPVPSLAGS